MLWPGRIAAALTLVPLVAFCSCGGGGGTCGAAPSQSPGVDGVLADAPAQILWSDFMYRHGGDCDPSPSQRGLSITIQSYQSAPAGSSASLSLCIPDPSQIPDGTSVPLSTAPGSPLSMVQISAKSSVSAGDAGSTSCTFSAHGNGAGDTASVTFQKLCGGNSSRILATFSGHITVSCPSGSPSARLDLSGTADVLPGT